MAVAIATSAARVRTGSDRRASRLISSARTTWPLGNREGAAIRGSADRNVDERAAALGSGLGLHRDDCRNGRRRAGSARFAGQDEVVRPVGKSGALEDDALGAA